MSGYLGYDLLNLLIEEDELIPEDGKDEMYDEVVAEIRDLEQSLEVDLQKFETTLGYVCQLAPVCCIVLI